MNELLQSASKIYLDANVLIYFVERSDELQEKIGALVDCAIHAGATIYMSDVGVAECLYGAYKANDTDLEDRYSEIFYSLALFTLIPVDSETILNAAKLGARHGLRLIDAAHVVSAIGSGSEVFVTNDSRIRWLGDMRVLQLAQL